MKARTQPFEDRHDAARCLAEALSDLALCPWPARGPARANGHEPHTVVVGLTRGGVPVARTVARQLHLPFDLLVVRKLPVPGNPELAMGAISEHDAEVLNEYILHWIIDAEETLTNVCEREQHELERRVRLYRGGHTGHPLAGNHVVLVDDGAATGATMRAAIAAARKAGAARVTVALPVAPEETCRDLAAEADEVRCLWHPDWFQSVGAYYRHFPQVSDSEVLEAVGNQASHAVPLRTASTPQATPHPLPF
jgi:putative phosphoribosyl transferase